jgi:hypothetical protein
MIKAILLGCIALVACNPSQNEEMKEVAGDGTSHTALNKDHLDTLKDTRFSRPAIEKQINDTLLKIDVLPNMAIHWNNRSGKLMEDSLLQKINDQFPAYKLALANEIRNTAPTSARACPGNITVTTGDLAFLIIDKAQDIPLYDLTHFQLDVLQAGCLYPYGLFDVLDKHRSYITKCVKDYLYNQGKF